MKRPPCIRNLAEFKKGCPQRAWNGEDGCPAWIEKEMSFKGGTEKIMIRECLDLWIARLHWGTNQLLEGNQQAIESFRNNMTVEGCPRPDPAMLRMLELIQNNKPLALSEPDA